MQTKVYKINSYQSQNASKEIKITPSSSYAGVTAYKIFHKTIDGVVKAIKLVFNLPQAIIG